MKSLGKMFSRRACQKRDRNDDSHYARPADEEGHDRRVCLTAPFFVFFLEVSCLFTCRGPGSLTGKGACSTPNFRETENRREASRVSPVRVTWSFAFDGPHSGPQPPGGDSIR